MRRHSAGVAFTLLALSLLSGGCAVGNWLVGAPSTRGTATPDALLARRCSGCHDTPDPATMSREDWLAALERMKKRMRLPESEWDSLAALSMAPAHR